MIKKLVSLILFFVINSFLVLNTQSETDFLINQTFSSKIGYTCEEVIGDHSCAGSEIYLFLKFSKETVSIIELV